MRRSMCGEQYSLIFTKSSTNSVGCQWWNRNSQISLKKKIFICVLWWTKVLGLERH